jgi:HSP20 family protein
MALLPEKRRGRGELARLHDEMDNLLGRFFGDWEWPVFGQARWPALDVAEGENEYVVKAEVPGCKADDIDISIHGNVLTISGEKKEEQEKKEKGYYHVERSYGSFRREVSLGGDVDADKIEAACKDGVLTITLPKSEKAKATKIKIKEQ